MYLEWIDIENFQKHSKLHVDFVNGVNVIWGASRTGKSCLRRAIDWVINNKKIDAVRKEGTKKTSVKIGFSNKVVLEKVRSQTINRYVLTVNGESKEFDSIGKEIPQEVKDAINLNPIEIDKESLNLNIAEQIALPFLLDKPASFRMKLFNTLTGNDLQDKLLGAFNKSLLRIGRSVKSQEESIEKSQKNLAEKKVEREKFEKIVGSFKGRYEKIKQWQSSFERLIDIQEQLEINVQEIEATQERLKNLKVVDDKIFVQVSQKSEKLQKLVNLRESILSHDTQINGLRTQIGTIKATELNLTPLQSKIERVEALNGWSEKYRQILVDKEQKEMDLEAVEIEFEGQETEYKKLLEETKICPTCLNPITKECLEKIKL